MGLETGDFIDDLDLTNPITATDPVTEGAAHLRLVKKVLLQSFPNIDAAVTATPAELNDLVTASGVEAITGNWTFSGRTALGNTDLLVGRNAANNADIALMHADAFDRILIGDSAGAAGLFNLVKLGGQFQWSIDSVLTGALEPGASTGLRVEAKAGGGTLTRVLTEADPATLAGARTFLESITLDNEKALLGKDSGGFAQFLARMSGTQVLIGTSGRTMRLDALTRIELRVEDVIGGRVLSPADGGLHVADIDLAQKKVGIRNPSLRQFGEGTHSASQNWEGQVIGITGGTPDINLGALEQGTSFILVFTTGTGQKRLLQSGTTIQWIDGASATPPTGTRLINGVSVVHVYYASTTVIDIWGNGIS